MLGIILGNFVKYECHTSEDALPPDQSRKKEQPKFTYSPLEKTLEKQTKVTESQGRKQIQAIMNQR